MPKTHAVYLYDGRGVYELGVEIPSEENSASSKKVTVLVYEIHSHLTKTQANALVKELKSRGAEVEYGEEP